MSWDSEVLDAGTGAGEMSLGLMLVLHCGIRN
jgi:predicted RNA methylase